MLYFPVLSIIEFTFHDRSEMGPGVSGGGGGGGGTFDSNKFWEKRMSRIVSLPRPPKDPPMQIQCNVMDMLTNLSTSFHFTFRSDLMIFKNFHLDQFLAHLET